jgi:dienelactone hydrolase
MGGIPEVTVVKTYNYDGLYIEELKWQLPYGRPTDAIMLKPLNVSGALPGILAFHDHGGKKYFGTKKITKTSGDQHPMMIEHQKEYYGGFAWANEIARRGYVVLVSDAFPFASRRVMMQDVPVNQRLGVSEPDFGDSDGITAYNNWAGEHEHIMAKSLFSAGTTWAGVFLAEDIKALDILCSRKDVDSERIGCGGLSGGGMRSVFLGGYDKRIKCAIPVGFMTTWRDLILHKSFTHTWMTYVPLLPKELDFPEIIGLRVPLPTLVLNDIDDDLFTLSEMQRADAMLKEVFEKAGSGSNYRCSFHPGPHKFDAKMQKEAFDWFDKWLKR